MKYIKYYKLEEGYHGEKDTHEYPTVSYTQDSDKVWYMKKNQVKMVFSITEDDVNEYGGEMMRAWESFYMFDSVTVDGVEQVSASEEYDVNVEVQDGDEFKLTDESFIPRPVISLTINFNEPLNQDSNIAFAFHDKWEENGGWFIESWIETLDDIKEYYNYSITTTQDGRISSITMDIGWEYDESYQLGVSIHTYADDEDPYELILSKDNVININIKYISGNLYLYLPTTEAKDYEVVATKYNNVTDMGFMFQFCDRLTSIDLSNFDTSDVINMTYMFGDCRSLTSLDLSNFDTSNVTYMSYMFTNCYSLTSLDLSNFDTSNVTYMSYMFYRCSGLTSLDVSNFDTSNVTNMNDMFGFCSGLTLLDLSNFNTSNVTDMSSMFYKCSRLTSIDLSSFDTSNVTDMSQMFKCNSGLTSLDLSHFDTNNVTNMSWMFNECSSLTSLDLSSFNTSKVTDMSYMFDYCCKLTSLDLSNFNTSNVTDMYYMFYNCRGLTSVTFGSQADVSKVTDYKEMFRYIYTTGTLYYPQAYANAWNNIIVTNQSRSYFPSTWTAMAVDYENE